MTPRQHLAYNLMQTMKIQEDLYDLCEDCFKYLALQIDKVFGEVKGLKEMKSPKSEKKDNLTVAARTANEEQVGPDSSKEVEEKVEINPSKEVGQLLVGKIGSTTLPSGASSLSGAHSAQINAALERAVADLQASLRRLEVFSVDANEMVKKWSELPVDMQRRNRHQDLSTGSSASKADVFWAHYMDRECDTGAKRKTQKLGPPASRTRCTGAAGSSPSTPVSAHLPFGTRKSDATSELSHRSSVVRIRSNTEETDQSQV